MTRAVLAIREHLGTRMVQAVPRGLLLDGLVATVLMTPLALAFSLSSGRWLSLRWFRAALVGAIASGIVFGEFVEFFFFEEFDARFNHVALDYLLFPTEVAGNIWQSYPVPFYVGLSLFVGALVAWFADSRVGVSEFVARPWRTRLVGCCLSLGGAALALGTLWFTPKAESGDRRVDEIASNGLIQLARAFETAGLDYDSYYRTVEKSTRDRVAQEELGWPDSDSPWKTFTAVERRDQPLDIVIVLGESFGSEFVGRLGGARPNAPGLERWAERGTLLTNVVPTGNRTVRGLEGVLCSFVPLPGDSVWKRDKSDDVATVARILRERGYRSEFVYGGDGAFDGMKSFALRNGWDAFFEDSLVGSSSYPSDAFRTIWGVADETLFTKVLERQKQAERDGVRYFCTALTVSNHKPYLTPSSSKLGFHGDKLVPDVVAGAVLLLVSVVCWRLFAQRARGALVAALVVSWSGLALHAWMLAQPHDTREAAVRYADQALAHYLDQADNCGLLRHTVVLFVGDHGARVYGAEEIPAASYRVPALILTPDAKYCGKTIQRLCSQIDLVPTLLSIAGIDFVAPFFGRDLLQVPADGPGRAFLIHNRDIGLLTDTALTVLGLQKTTTCYRRSDRGSDSFTRVECGAESEGDAQRAAAVFQTASILYESERYRVADDP